MRHIVWAIAAALLAAPAIAMRLTDEVKWDAADFVIFGAMLVLACVAFEGVAAATTSAKHRAAFGIGILAVFLLVWAQLAVGIVGPG